MILDTEFLGNNSASEEVKAEYNEMCLIVSIKLRHKPLRECTPNELNGVIEFLDAIINTIESYPQEKSFQKDNKQMRKLRMNANYLLHQFEKSERDCLFILKLLEAEKRSFDFYEAKYGIGALVGADTSLNEEINHYRKMLNIIRSRFKKEISILNLHDFVFYSGHHYRFEQGSEVGGGAVKRVIRIQDSISGNEGYSVTIYDTEEDNSLREDRVSMSTKPMKIVASSPTETEMCGWGVYTVPLAGIQIPYSNYGLTIYHPYGQVEEIVLHMFDRNVDIKYKL